MIVSIFFTKVDKNRLTVIAHIVVHPTHMTSMPGQHILEGVDVLHETIHELHSKNLEEINFISGFVKPYDKVI